MMTQAAVRAKPLTVIPAPSGSLKRPVLQRKCACGGSESDCEECRKERPTLQRRPIEGRTPTIAPPIVHDVLRSPGEPLEAETRAFMESRLGHDFRHVRVHDDAKAIASARSVAASAYTVGSHVVFGAPGYEPRTTYGRNLLGHELAHVVQQRTASLPADLEVGDPASAEEREAGRIADLVTSERDPVPGAVRIASSVNAVRVARDVTRPRAATGSAVLSDVTSQPKGPAGHVSAGSLAKQEWESLFSRHFTEPDKVEGEVESRHPRYMYSRIYGWIDAQHFFAHIEFAENQGLEGAMAEGLRIEKRQKDLRTLIGPEQDDPTAYSTLLESNLIDPDDFLHYREGLFIAIAAGLNTLLSPRERGLIKGFDERQLAKLILDNAMSAFSFEDIVSNQLGVQLFRIHGSDINAGGNADEVRKRFVARMTEYFRSIQIEEDPTAIKRLGAKLPGKERWTAPKMTEAQARKKFPELFRFDDATHRVRVAVYNRDAVAQQKLAELKHLVRPRIPVFVDPYGDGRYALYAGPLSHFEAVLLKWAIDRAMPTGKGGSLVEPQPLVYKKRVYGPEP